MQNNGANGSRKKKSLSQRLGIYHRYNKRQGLYTFFRENYKKMLLILGAFVALVLVANYFFDLESLADFIVDNYPTDIVFVIFYISETLFGLIPPDFFILWVQGFEIPYMMVGLLALISYLGGLSAYAIGRRLRLIKRFKGYLERKYDSHMKKIRKWGGIVIVFAALFPLPYATTCLAAGLLKYPFSRLLYLGVFRIARFYLYALVLYGVIS